MAIKKICCEHCKKKKERKEIKIDFEYQKLCDKKKNSTEQTKINYLQ